jgi:hypothetical protein
MQAYCHDPYLRGYNSDTNFFSPILPTYPLLPILPYPCSDYGLLVPDGYPSPIYYDSYIPEGSTYMTQY